MSRIRHILARIRRVAYWLLPLAILGFILARIDLVLLYETVTDADPMLYGLGVVCLPISILPGAIRWKVLIEQYWGFHEKLGYLICHYWIGLSLSIFLPGQVGMDIYRVAITSRRFGKYTPNIAIVLEEKFLALVVCAGLVLGVTPWLAVDRRGPVLGTILDLAYAILAACFLALILSAFTARSTVGQKLTAIVTNWLNRAFVSILRKLKVDHSRLEPLPAPTDLFRPMGSVVLLMPVLLISAASFFVLAVGNQLFLLAVGYELPFIASLFVVSVLFFVVSVPISFAGFGVREGTYILLLGLFGVSPETALVIAFFALSGVFLNYAIGGIFILAIKSVSEADTEPG